MSERKTTKGVFYFFSRSESQTVEVLRNSYSFDLHTILFEIVTRFNQEKDFLSHTEKCRGFSFKFNFQQKNNI